MTKPRCRALAVANNVWQRQCPNAAKGTARMVVGHGEAMKPIMEELPACGTHMRPRTYLVLYAYRPDPKSRYELPVSMEVNR